MMKMSNENLMQPSAHTDDISVANLQAAMQGHVIRPGDDEYDDARSVWNGMIDKRPALIARCAAVEDVVAAVHFARERNLRVSVRGGGHNVAGHAVCNEGVVIDLSLMHKVEVDPIRRVVRAEGGATIAHVDTETQRFGLAVPLGVVSATGIAGLTLGGGYGWLRSKYGLSCDNLIGAQVVTADGSVVHANEEENFDLLWGLRGGGGNFGIVTQFTYRAHPVGPEVMFVFAFKDGRGERMRDAIRFYRDYSESAPEEVSTLMACGHFPPELHEIPFVLFAGMYAGPPADGQRVMQPLLDHGETLIDHSSRMPYVDAQQMLDADYPNGMRYYWKSLNLTRLDDDVIDRIVYHARRQPSSLNTTDLWHIGGAVANGKSEESAFYGRQVPYLLSPEANWEEPADDESNITWLREFVADMEAYSDGSRYLNFPGFHEEGDEMIRSSYGPHYTRLAALKQKYDPDNFFRLNQNVKPAEIE